MPEPPLLTISQARLGYGGRPLFAGAGFSLHKGDKSALVGRNGSGKSSLLRAAAGLAELDEGTRFLQPGTTVGYLEQEPASPTGRRVDTEILAGLPADKAGEDFRAEMMLEPLGLAGERDLASLSGGERRRVALAKALVGDPDLLLLDEPTNHLDLPAIEWLEGLLKRYRGALLVISHDRRFLSNLTASMLWLDRGTLHQTDQGFAHFEDFAARIRHEEEKAREREAKMIARETQWLREGLTARRKRDQGRLRRLQQLREQRRQRQDEAGQAKVTLGEATGGSRLVLEAEGLSKSVPAPEGSRPIVRNFGTRILRGDRVGFIGPNGAGKTTLLRLLLGQLEPDGGTLRHGADFAPIYFDQKRAGLTDDMTPREYLCPNGGEFVTVQGQSRHVASYMRDFLFSNGQVEQPARALSGGERNRLMLARLFAEPGNVLVLDEPTNDLDMDTLDLLEDVLSDYDGTVLLVSHDRQFLDNLVTSVVALEGNGEAVEIVGGFDDYNAWRQKRAAESDDAPSKGKAKDGGAGKKSGGGSAKPAAGSNAGKGGGAAPSAPHKLSYKQKRELAELPEKMDKLQKDIDRLQDKLADPGFYSRDPEGYNATADQLTKKQNALEAAETRWLELEELREQLEA